MHTPPVRGPTMSIEFSCDCGKQLRVKDALAGKRIKCPACEAALTVPVAEEDIEEVVPVPEKRALTPRGKPRREEAEEEEERPRGRRRRDEDEEPEEEEEERPRKKKRRRERSDSGNSMAFGSIALGLLLIVGSVVIFIVGLMNGVLWYGAAFVLLAGVGAIARGVAGGSE